jgi:[acyl-carrier-protein] S-malonyltransferase
MALAKARGAKRALMLPMSVPSHCALMKPAAEKLAEYLGTVAFSMPDTPVVHNMNVAVSVTAEEIKAALVEQLFRPVRWIDTIQYLAGHAITSVVECVPGKILTGLNKRIDANLACHAVTDSGTLDAAIAATR